MAMLAAALLLFGTLPFVSSDLCHPRGDIPPIVALWVLGVGARFGIPGQHQHISLGRFYRDRLMEAFMPGYDAALEERTEAAPQAAERMRLAEASMPHPITSSIPTSSWSARKTGAERSAVATVSFLPVDYCGSNATGWRKTDEFMAGKMNLPTAMAISGAAANPNTGVGGVGLSRSKVVSALMALVNLRLGYWVPHPTKGAKPERHPKPFPPRAHVVHQRTTEECRFRS